MWSFLINSFIPVGKSINHGEEVKSSKKGGDHMELGLMAIGAGLAIGLAAIATAIAQAKIGAAGIGALIEKPELLGRILILLVIPETLVILGFVIAVIILSIPR